MNNPSHINSSASAPGLSPSQSGECSVPIQNSAAGNSYGQILRSSSIVGGAQAINYLIGLVRTKLVAVTQVANAIGTVTPVATLTRLAHQAGARVLIDGAQSVPHLPVDFAELGVGYATGGPDGHYWTQDFGRRS